MRLCFRHLLPLLLLTLLRPAAHAAPVTITYMGWGNPQEVEIVNTLIAAFEKKHPDIHVNYILAPQFEDKLRTMMAGDIPPDIFYMPVDSLPIYARKNTLLNLDPLLKASKWDTSDFFPQVLNAFKYQNHQYGLPKDFTTEVVYYNKDIFDRDHIPYPKAGWTWDDMLRDAKATTHDFDHDGRIDQFGIQYRSFSDGVSAYYPWFRQAGAKFFDTDAQGRPTKFTLNSPEGRHALQFLHDLDYKDNVALSSSSGAGRDAQAEFSNGHIALFANYGRWLVPRFREMNKFRWDVAPLPRSKENVNVVITVAYSISAKSKHPREAFELMRFLLGPEGQTMSSDLGLAIPSIKSVAYGPHFINPKHDINDMAFLTQVAWSELPTHLPNPDEFDDITKPIWEQVLNLDSVTPDAGLAKAEPQVNTYLTKYINEQEAPPVPWRAVAITMAAIAAALIAGIVLFFRRAGGIGKLARAEERIGYLFISPWIIGMLLFSLFPIVTSLLMSLCDWDAIRPLNQATWLGLANYHRALALEPLFWQAMRVTVIYSLFSVPIGLVLSVCIAVLLNQKVKGIPAFRTIYFLPSLVGGVSVAVLWWRIFNRDFGVLNYGLMHLGVYNHIKPIDWLGSEQWALPAFVLMSLWGVGGGMLIYLAGLQGIPTQLYEAASIDGASKWKQFWAVTLPMLTPVIFFNLIMGIIGSFQVFTQAKVMTDGGPNNATLFYVLYLFKKGFQEFDMGYASALAWILFAVVLVLTGFVMRSSKSWVHYEGAKD